MKYRLLRLFANTTYSIFSSPERLSTWVRIRLLRIDRRVTVLKADGDLAGNVAIVVTYPRTPLARSTERLLQSLTEHGYRTVLVVNGLARDCPAAWTALASHVLVRPNIGRDFGGYQAATRYLVASADSSRLGRVAYFNDSVFYPPELAKCLSNWLSGKAEVSSLYVNLEARPHMQTFAFYIAGSHLRGSRVRKFWRTYYPSNQRMHAIRKGEIRLSRALVRDGALFDSYLTWHRLDAALGGDWDHLLPAEVQALRVPVGKTADPYMRSVIRRALRNSDTPRYSELTKVFLTTRNASASCGPLATRALGLPLKLDLVKSGYLTLADYEETLRRAGSSTAEVDSVMTLINTSGSLASSVGLRRIWRDFGHY